MSSSSTTGLAPLADTERRDLLEIIEDRHGHRSTVVTSQIPIAKWHDHLGDPTVADAICDRLLHNAHPLVLQGPSRRGPLIVTGDRKSTRLNSSH